MRVLPLCLLAGCGLSGPPAPVIDGFGEVTVSRPDLGRYLTEIHHVESGFISMEASWDASVEAMLRLDLGANGRVRMCTASRRFDAGSISHYQSPDGLDHHNSQQYSSRSSWAGTWAASAATVVLRVQATADCEEDPDPTMPFLPPIRCVSIEKSDLPGPAIACAVPQVSTDLRYPAPYLSMAPGDPVRPPGQWLVFGGGEGLKFTMTDSHVYDVPPAVTWEVAKVSWDPRSLARN